MADDIVKKITIVANGQDINSTRGDTEKLSAAVTQLTAATVSNKDSYKAQTDALNANTAAHESLWSQLLKVTGVVTGLALAWAVVKGVVNEVIDVVGFIIKLPVYLITEAVKTVTNAWEATTVKLAEYITLAQKAGSLDVSTNFYQTQTKGAEALQITNDSIIKQMETLRTATTDQLGGSTGQKRVDELVSFGNFKGNTGVSDLKSATTQEEKYTAVLNLIKQATDAGERLAAVDVAKTMLGKDAADNLLKDSEYFDKMQLAANKVATAELIPDADVSRALDLANRLQAANDIIEKKWWPAQRDGLNPLVMFFKEMWVEIVELVASAFSWAEKLVNKLISIPSAIWEGIKDAYAIVTTGYKQPEGPVAPGNILTPDQQARAALTTGLQNPNTVRLAGTQTLSASDLLRKDKSKSKLADTPDAPDTASWDRARDSILKYIEVTKAASLSVDATAGEQEKLKAVAQLTAAAQKDGTTVTAAMTTEMQKLGTAAGAAADALAKAKVASQIKFGQNTAFLSSEDVSIATQLKHIYPDVATALNSVQASGLRTNAALSGLSSQLSGTLTTGLTDILDGTKSVSNGFADMSKIIIRAIEEMIVKLLIVGPLMRALQSSLGGGITVPGFNPIAGISGHAAGTDNSPGGWHWVGENGPELMNVPKGAKVLPNGVMPDGGGVSAPVSIHIDATGADAAGLARVESQLARLRTELPATIVSTVKKAKTNRVL